MNTNLGGKLYSCGCVYWNSFTVFWFCTGKTLQANGLILIWFDTIVEYLDEGCYENILLLFNRMQFGVIKVLNLYGRVVAMF